MEEKATTSGQTNTKGIDPQQKISYDDLKRVAIQLKQQNDELVAQMQTMGNIEKRLYFLFEVLKHHQLFGEEYIKTIVDEIKDIITLPTEESNTQEEEK